jgi:hypothetical protein
MRHQLFEEVMRMREFDPDFAKTALIKIIKQNAESILAANTSSKEAYREIMRFYPQIVSFANQYTKIGPAIGRSNTVASQFAILESHRDGTPSYFVANAVDSIEDVIVSPELGLKGNVDMIVRATTVDSQNVPLNSIMAIELKTNHNQQTHNAHLMQLLLYTLMLRTRYGSTSSKCMLLGSTNAGVLLYMNGEALRAVYVSSTTAEIKSLVGQRNLVAIETLRASYPRGVDVLVDNDNQNQTPRYVQMPSFKN